MSKLNLRRVVGYGVCCVLVLGVMLYFVLSIRGMLGVDYAGVYRILAVDVARYAEEHQGRLPDSWKGFEEWSVEKEGKLWSLYHLNEKFGLNWGKDLFHIGKEDKLILVLDQKFKYLEPILNGIIKNFDGRRNPEKGRPKGNVG